MENNKKQVGVSSSSTTFDHLFGPKYPSSATSSSSTSGIFGSIFPPPSTVLGRDSTHDNRGGSGKYGNPDIITKNNGKGESVAREKGSSYQKDHEIMEPCHFNSEPACYFSSSIYYGGQENYSPRTRSTESQHIFKKDGGDDDSNGNNPNSASRGNWWQGSLYY
ncbi:hypothetical protein I3843_02G164600 [Carya illinoinensis]|uniref:Uncharacterized protein n=1 Tax=Carya illinoinensis TaxID=32201 RepID=A0A922FXS5_CARIL|nr:hypothetical protein I3760_02G188000 [Carya illinoinensis]KAG6728688.1 hypothetical protein I3842_02G185400 [Carya illinoinensis]KAG7993171.1 hypothetical protein I3843_02G164600 [Carya illinoinensis]KAG7993172.1 hypothetical protein I3843_02G164600 [Carya illinoinensis]